TMGAVRRAPLSGGTAVTIANSSPFPSNAGQSHIEIVRPYVIFATMTAVRRMEEDGSNVTDLATTAGSLNRITYGVFGGAVYFADGSGNIKTVSINGGPVTTLATSTSISAITFVVVGSTLVWIDVDTWDIYSLPLSGGTATRRTQN